MRVLLIEDEQALAQFIRKGFVNEGYDLTVAYDGLTGQSMLRQHRYDLLIIDVNLPHINGLQLCREARSLLPGVPVLMLTALDSLADKIKGFEAGADDYLAKPFAFKELLLRAQALTRRHGEGKAERQVLRLGDLEMNLTAKTVTRAEQRISLTTREYALLEFLMLNQGKVVTRVDINEKVWDLHFDTNTNVIDVYVSHLRKKIDKQHEQKLIHTVVGTGYEMRVG